MNTLHFKYVAEIAKTGSITQAAENLFMAQPNLSKAVKELEETLGFSIFRRTSKGVVLTEKGEEFLVYAKRVLTQIGKMEALAGGESREGNRLSVCLPQGTYLSYGFSRFAADCSVEEELEIKVKEADFLQGVSLISQGEVSFGILRIPSEYLQYFQGFLAEKDLCFQMVWEWESVVVMNNCHALAKAPEVTAARLLDFVEIVPEEVPLPSFPGGEGTTKKSLGRTITAQGGETLLSLVAGVPNGYLWTSPLPKELLKQYGLEQRRCKDKGRMVCDLLVYPKEYSFTAMDRKLIDTISVTKNQVAFENF